MKATALAPSNIAFIKYWGRIDEISRLPTNSSISMNLSGMHTVTTVEFSIKYERDDIEIDGQKNDRETERIVDHLDRIRNLAKIDDRARVVSRNNFPSSTGLSSSASGFATLTVSASKAAGLELPEKKLSVLARLASGSACRSIPDGFVEWEKGIDGKSSYAFSLYPSNWWQIADVVVIVSQNKKDIPTTQGQKLAGTSPFFKTRLDLINEKIKECKNAISERNFLAFGNLIEKEALEMHAVMLTSDPPLIYWQPATLQMMKLVEKWRKEGLQVYFTVNTGQDIHLICKKDDIERVMVKLKSLDIVRNIIINYPAEGARLVKKHLF